jgi:hypothetical protein
MKPSKNMLFGNLFDDRRITPYYLSRFAQDVLAKLQENNNGDMYNLLISPLQTAFEPFRKELGEVDTTLNEQVGKTQTVDEFIKQFVAFMKDYYVNIAAALGNEKATAFKEFYPNGKSEYTKASKTKIPTIVDRLYVVSEKYSDKLGPSLTEQLRAFKPNWDAVRQSQLQQKSAVKTNRSDRTTARRNVEIELLKIIHFIAYTFPGDVKKSMTFFDFNLLFGVRRSKDNEDQTP